MPSRIETQLAKLKQGDHVCLYDGSDADQLEVVAAYIRQGLGRRDDRVRAETIDAPPMAGSDMERERARGALVLLASYDARLKDERFNAEAMLALLNDSVEEALQAGLRHCVRPAT